MTQEQKFQEKLWPFEEEDEQQDSFYKKTHVSIMNQSYQFVFLSAD